ncbi:DedA family protein [Erythrobacter sp. LQ02-29]|uniref:DedA family protein n=1 Tax=Erythrobacter sp. LQ02-29 TaxID=2920384 RepID=UPI001F4D8EC1|nr:DedA family protein [Erythrobacter sp. LQ02-29]MCP9222156.1 DedA family protein [Erythrobacter sp. LQ02-29]
MAGTMSIETLIARFGLPAIFVGAAIEGETVVATGGLIAHRGLLPVAGVIAAAAAGSFLADQAFFWLGRSARQSRIVARIRRQSAYARALRLIERYPTAFIFAFRFLWGLRTVSPVAIGTSQIDWRRFAILNAVAALVWSSTVTAVGYALAGTLAALGARLRTVEHYALAIVLLAALAAGFGWWLRRRLRGGKEPGAR